MPRPAGIAKTGGRKKGTSNKRTQALEKAAGPIQMRVTPLEFMLKVMDGSAIPKNAPPAVRAQLIALQFDAAKAAAPYVHARLTAIAVAHPPGGSFGAELTLPQDEPSMLDIGRRVAYTLHVTAKMVKETVS